MEGRCHNFEEALSHFQEHLRGAWYVTVDMELTGVDIDGEPDCYEESAEERLDKLCRIAEEHVPIQMGFTIVHKEPPQQFRCTSYNFFAFPWTGPERLGDEPRFSCQASALRFNGRNNVDFNAWIKEGVPYMSRQDEARYLRSPLSQGDRDLPRKLGLLRLWKALCNAKVPIAVHCPLDLFFLLSCFEQRRLPRKPRELAQLVLRCVPCVFDTAHLHGLIGGFKSLSLERFVADAKRRHEQDVKDGVVANRCLFRLEAHTAARYGSGAAHAHEAGYDSLLTAQLLAYLISISPDILRQGAYSLFLYKSTDFIDLETAATTGVAGVSIFDMSRVTPLVGELASNDYKEVQRNLAEMGLEWRWMDRNFVLVLIRSAGSAAARQVNELNLAVPGVARWLSLREWQVRHPQAQARVLATHDEARSGEEQMMDVSPPPDRRAQHYGAGAAISEAWSEAALDTRTRSGPRYRGVIKSFYPARGFGFISCPETYASFQRDVFVHHSQIQHLQEVKEVSFAISTNSRGHPQAKDVQDANVGEIHDLDTGCEENAATRSPSSGYCSSEDVGEDIVAARGLQRNAARDLVRGSDAAGDAAP